MATTKQPNHLLRYEREKRGLSQRKVADLLETSEEMVSRWERGERKTSPFYQEKLCQIFGKDAVALGFLDPPAFPAPDEASQAVQEEPSPTFLSSTVRTPTHALDLLLTSPGIPVEQQAGAWLTLGANSLGPLFDEGWTVENVLHALEIVLQGVQAMPAISRRHLIQLGVAAVASSIPIPTRRHISTEDRIKLHQALSESIATAWKLFHTAGNAQVLAVGQAQLFLVQQNHALLYPSVQPLLYTGTYRLIGAALFFQEKYEEALRAQNSAYTAALESADTWNMAQCRTWQAYCYQSQGQHDRAIQAIEAALRLTEGQMDEASRRSKSHLLACWAENATFVHEHGVAQEKLEASLALLDGIGSNEEFDRSHWLQIAGNCALRIKNYPLAVQHFEESLGELSPDWIMRYAVTAIPLARAYAQMRARDKSLAVVRKAVSLIDALNAPIINRQLAEYIQHDLPELFPRDTVVQTFVTDMRRQLPQVAAIVE